MPWQGSHDDGRIPFRLRVGVTGHRALESEAALTAEARRQVRRLVGELGGQHTEVALAAVSQLADGADRLVVREVLAVASERREEARLECFLPLRRHEYVEVQRFDSRSREEFEDLLEGATVVREPTAADDPGRKHGDAYRSAGHLLVGRCDVLIALWDGRPSGGRGGTAETLVYAAARSKPCIWIETGGLPVVHDNLDPGAGKEFFEKVSERAALEPPIRWSPMDHPDAVMEPLREAIGYLDELNGEPDPPGYRQLVERELSSEEGLAAWLVAPLVRVGHLAVRWQRRFQWTARIVTFLAALAAVMLAMDLSFGGEMEGWAWAEAAMFALALGGLIAVRRIGFHRRWLSYRVLAERLRSARFLAPTGADFRRQARLEAVYTGSEPTSWLVRAFEEVWDRRPLSPPPIAELPPADQRSFKNWLAEGWIGEQISYHRGKVRHHRRWHKILATSVLLLFVGTIVFAVLHSLHYYEDTAVFFSIVLPAAGASLGVLMTVNQHHALSERSARMESDLVVLRRDILDAPSENLDTVSSEAARTIAQETSAWFGSMWFLDIEHP